MARSRNCFYSFFHSRDDSRDGSADSDSADGEEKVQSESGKCNFSYARVRRDTRKTFRCGMYVHGERPKKGTLVVTIFRYRTNAHMDLTRPINPLYSSRAYPVHLTPL